MNVVDFAEQILDMQDELNRLRHENARLRNIEKEYWDFLNESNRASEQAMVGWLDKILDGSLTVNKPVVSG